MLMPISHALADSTNARSALFQTREKIGVTAAAIGGDCVPLMPVLYVVPFHMSRHHKRDFNHLI